MESSMGDDNYSEALDNTVEIARLCEYEMEFGHYKYPVFHVPDKNDLNEVIREAAVKGLNRRLAQLEKDIAR